MTIRRTSASACLNCGKTLNSVSTLTDVRAPEPGDITVCIQCRHVMILADDMSLRELTYDEVVEVAGDPDLVATMRALGALERWEDRRASLIRST